MAKAVISKSRDAFVVMLQEWKGYSPGQLVSGQIQDHYYLACDSIFIPDEESPDFIWRIGDACDGSKEIYWRETSPLEELASQAE